MPCFDPTNFIASDEFSISLLIFLLLISIFISILIAVGVAKITKIKFFQIPFAFVSSYISFLFLFVLSIFVLLQLESIDDNIASYYFPLNAAIKNTCYLDKNKINCPKNLDELIAIEPENFYHYKLDSILDYEYRPETNEYTLVALNRIGRRGAIFDPRLKSSGYDFLDLSYTICGNKITIKDPPNFDGILNKYK